MQIANMMSSLGTALCPPSTVSLYACVLAHVRKHALMRVILMIVLLSVCNLAGAQKSKNVTKTRPSQDSILVSAPVKAVEKDSTLNAEPAEKELVPFVGLSTNLLYDAACALTDFNSFPIASGLELPLGKHWSLTADYIVTAPWRAWNSNAECAQLMHLSLGGRWYPVARKPLAGWYVSALAGVGYYDFERGGRGYQGEDFLAAIGGGYSFPLGDHLRLNFGIGAGPLLTRYRFYEGVSNNEHLMFRYRGVWRYFGPTDARLSLTWLIWRHKPAGQKHNKTDKTK